jgi:BirA family biotin operon repressor/biotin-[acetyl-CoA-carboxylase] ligase
VTAHPPANPSLNIELLNQLRAAEGRYVPLDLLGADVRETRRALSALEDFGFAIEHHPLLGAAYRGPAARLCPDQLEYQLGTREIGRRIAVWDRVTSTNDLAARGSRSTANHGLVVMAEDQSAGRGRQGRAWIAPPRSSILMSILLFPPARLTASDAPKSLGTAWLTALAAVAVAETVSQLIEKPAQIKWPNDVRVAKRKIAGILVEQPAVVRPTAAEALNHDSHAKPVVIGIGLNVNLRHDRLPESLRDSATSVLIESQRSEAIDRTELARSLIRNLDRWYGSCLEDGLGPLSAAWTIASEHHGQVVRMQTVEGAFVGRLINLDLEHGLIVELGDQKPRSPEDPLRSQVRVALSRILSLGVEPPESKMATLMVAQSPGSRVPRDSDVQRLPES